MDRRTALQYTLGWYGAALSTPLIMGVLAGCGQGKPDLDWTPHFLTDPDVNLLDAVSQLMFPSTETPGATEAGVVSCVDILLANCATEEDQVSFRNALELFNTRSAQAHGKPFPKCTSDDQGSILTQVESEAFADESKMATDYQQFKSLLMVAFYTSEPVMRSMLNYSAIAGRFDACIPLEEEGRVFVDNNV